MKEKLPDGWEWKKLSQLLIDKKLVFQNGFACGKNNQNGNGLPQLRPMNINSDGQINLNSIKFVETDKDIGRYVLKKEDIIFNNTNSPELVGKTTIWNEELDCSVLSNHMTILRLSSDSNAFPKYVAKYLHSLWVKRYFEQICTNHINQSSVGISGLKEINIPLPPLDVQQKIVSILEKAEETKRLRAQADELTQQLLKSVFLEMFGDPVKNEKGWEVLKFSKVGTLERGKSKHRPRNAPELLNGPYPLIQTGDVANSGMYIRKYSQTYSELGLKQSRMWPAGTLCITIAANIAKTGILAFEACFPDSVVGFIPNRQTKTEYVQFWLSFLQKTLEDSAPESAQKNINLKILSNLDIPLPPLPLQQKFASIVGHAERIREQQAQSSQQINVLFDSLMQKAFTGELVS